MLAPILDINSSILTPYLTLFWSQPNNMKMKWLLHNISGPNIIELDNTPVMYCTMISPQRWLNVALEYTRGLFYIQFNSRD